MEIPNLLSRGLGKAVEGQFWPFYILALPEVLRPLEPDFLKPEAAERAPGTEPAEPEPDLLVTEP